MATLAGTDHLNADTACDILLVPLLQAITLASLATDIVASVTLLSSSFSLASGDCPLSTSPSSWTASNPRTKLFRDDTLGMSLKADAGESISDPDTSDDPGLMRLRELESADEDPPDATPTTSDDVALATRNALLSALTNVTSPRGSFME